MTKILFDIGANHGTDSIKKISKDKDWVCFAFEPTPELVNHLKNQSRNIADRYFVYQYAISNFNGKSEFNIAGQKDWGCSSLLQFSDNLQSTWPGRTDFKVTKTITVDVITLKTFIQQICPFNIEKIDYFHCDVQGSDLNVLEGLEEYINFIQEGVIEAAKNNDVKLYKNQHTKDEAINFLLNNNFKITNEISNDVFRNEYNIFFKKKT